MKKRVCALLLLCVAVVLAGGCGTFGHEWKTAALQPGSEQDLQGRWEGVWVSDVNRHTDKLRCIIRRNPDGTYRARFRAKYRKVLSFSYTVSLTAQPSGGGFNFQGDANLGWYAGGLYHYEGRADATNFYSAYSCKYDHGTFRLGRPGSSG